MNSRRAIHLRTAIFIERCYPFFGVVLSGPHISGLSPTPRLFLGALLRGLPLQDAASFLEILDLLLHPRHDFVPDGTLVSFRPRHRHFHCPLVLLPGQLPALANTYLPRFLDRIVGPDLSPPNGYSSLFLFRHFPGLCMPRIECSTNPWRLWSSLRARIVRR